MDHDPQYKPIGEAIGFENWKKVEEKYEKDWREGNYDFENHADETQAIFVQTRIRANKLIEHRVPTYLYEYTYPKHARHTDDLFYIMGVHSFEMDENERRLAQVYVKMFANFAKFGEPRVHGFDVTKRGSYFDVFWNETSGERPAMKEHFEQNIINYWLKDMVAYDKNVTKFKKMGRNPNFVADNFWVVFLITVLLIIVFLCLIRQFLSQKQTRSEGYELLDGRDQVDID